MRHDEIRALIKNKVETLSVLSNEISPDFDKEKIHDFRINVKTLRSFLRLPLTDMEHDDLKLPKKLKRLYHILGGMRDAQLELDKLKERQLSLPAYVERRYYIIGNQKKEWDKRYSTKILHRLATRYAVIRYKKIEPVVLIAFVSARISAIDELSRIVSPTYDQIHTIRKLLKDILYNIKLAKKHWKDAYMEVQCLPIKQMSALADLIGDFNDDRQTLEHLASFASKDMEVAEETIIRNTCNQEKERLGVIKIDIMDKVRDLIKTVKEVPACLPAIL